MGNRQLVLGNRQLVIGNWERVMNSSWQFDRMDVLDSLEVLDSAEFLKSLEFLDRVWYGFVCYVIDLYGLLWFFLGGRGIIRNFYLYIRVTLISIK